MECCIDSAARKNGKMISKDILNAIKDKPFSTQRQLAEDTDYSLGKVNQALKQLQDTGYLDAKMRFTNQAYAEFAACKPKNAIILASGYGIRMIPINMETPKGLLEINGEILIERLIRQLQEKGIQNITVVVGFLKEYYEYLIDRYGVNLKVNMEYAEKNNLHSLAAVADEINNTYILPCDVWCAHNPFSEHELYSWYMVSDMVDDESNIRVNRAQRLVKAKNGGNQMVGIAYLTGGEAECLRKRVPAMDKESAYQDAFWEEALYDEDRMMVAARVASSKNVYEINTYEQLRELDHLSKQLHTEKIDVVASALGVEPSEITEISILKKGMTNRSFLFLCKGRQYIMRIPGEGTDQLINREQEYNVYQTIKDSGLCDDVVYMDPGSGYKVSVFLPGARVCDAENPDDVKKCMAFLRAFHERNFEVSHCFDIFEKIAYYESLWNGQPSIYRDYLQTKQNIQELKQYIDKQPKALTLTHIDAVPDNFLLIGEGEQAELRLIDWEYAGMQDPHVDIAMFAIYAGYGREQTERLIDAYFPEGCTKSVRLKIYAYIAACGLLWSNWCEYKRQLGVEFGEYSLYQYRYAKDYYRLFKRSMEEVQSDVQSR